MHRHSTSIASIVILLISLQARAVTITFESVPATTLLSEEFASQGVRFSSGGVYSGLVLTEGTYGFANFGNSPTQLVFMGLHDQPTTITFVDPSNPNSIIGARSVSVLVGDANPDLETIIVTYKNPIGQVIKGPTVHNLSDTALLLSEDSYSAGSVIGSIELRLALNSESGALFDDLSFNLASGEDSSWPGSIYLDVEGFNDNFWNPPTIVRASQTTIATVSPMTLFPDDSDVIRFMGLASGQTVTALTTPIGEVPVSPDTVVGIFDATEALVDFNDDAGGGFGSVIHAESDGSEPLFVGLSGLPDSDGNHGQTGVYLVTLSVVTPNASQNIVNIQRDTSPVVRAGINTLIASTVQRIPISGVQPGDVISAATTPLHANGRDGPDARIALFGPDGAVLIDNDDAAGLGSALRWSASGAGNYELKISGSHDDSYQGRHASSGDVGVTVSIVPLPEPSDILTIIAGTTFLSLLRRNRL